MTVSPAVPGPAPALDLDAVSDYVPALDDGLALDYGPIPDNEAARDYGKAIEYDALPGHTVASHHIAATDHAAVRQHATAHGDAPLRLAPGHGQDAPMAVPGAAGRAPAPAQAQADAPAVSPGTTSEPAPTLHLAPRPHPATAAHPAPRPGHAPDSAQAPDPVPGLASAAAPDPAQEPGPAIPAHVPPAEDLWAPDPAAQVTPATYWRRRLVALGVGIAALTVLAWAVSGVLQGPGNAQGHGAKPSTGPSAAHGHKGSNRSGQHNAGHSGRGGHTARGHAPKALPESAAGRARTISAPAGHHARGTLSGVSDVLAMAGAPQRKGSAASRASHRSPARGPGHLAMARVSGPHIPACGRGDVVLSLVSPRCWYQRGRWPLFGVDAVSTASRPCRFNMGSRFATVVVTSGRTRIWGSADCAPGTGSQSVVLSRGVPAVRWIYWDRAISSPGCRPPHQSVHQGAYTAIAFDGQLSSQVLVFILGRPGTSLP